MVVPNEAAARQRMAADGLRINYARAHPGQGTANVCACLDDVFLELLWFDGSPISDETMRIGLGGRANAGSPFGIAWRGEPTLDVDRYAAPFLDDERTLPVWSGSAAVANPFIFGSPGGVAPARRTDGLPGERQRPELVSLGSCVLRHPELDAIREAIDPIEGIELERGQPALRMTLLRPDGTPGRDIVWR